MVGMVMAAGAIAACSGDAGSADALDPSNESAGRERRTPALNDPPSESSDTGKTAGDPATTTDAGPNDPSTPTAGSAGYLHTDGAQIKDDKGRVVRLTGLSWFGMETSNYAPHGLWARSMASMLDQVALLGYNMIRVPYTNQMFDAGSAPNGIDFAKNPDLEGRKAIEILDKLIDGAAARGLRIVLDRHRPDASGQSALWYTPQVSEQRWIDDWKMLAARYKGKPTVVGFDLHNEPHGNATWGDGNAQTDWRLAAERAGAAVLGVNPDLLMFVEGVEQAGGKSYWWGGNLRNAIASPVRLPVPGRLVYSPHEYPGSVFAQPWFSDPAYPKNLPAVWDEAWGSVAKTTPVWIGEFGTKDQTKIDQAWFRGLATYIQSRGLSFAFWCLNPDSGDTGGILADDWQTVNAGKQAVLQPILAPKL
jgi:endoglucanase